MTNTYQKADSLVRLHHQKIDQSKSIARLRKLRASVRCENYRDKIVQKACDDVLMPADESDASRFYLRTHILEELASISDQDLARYIFYRYRYEIFPRTFQVDDYPPCLQIEPASICNYRCVFCYQTDLNLTQPKNGHMGMMDLDLFKRVVDQAEGHIEAITLASRGEPLICRNIEEMLAYLKGKFLGLKINTNAWFLDERKSHAILQSGVNTLVFSADAAEERLYSQLRVNGSLKRVVENIERFQKIRVQDYPDANLITRVSGVRYSDEQTFGSMEAFWADLVDQVAFVDYVPWENVYEQPTNEILSPCSDLFRRMFVWWDGRVNPCDVDYLSTLSTGSAKEQSLSEIWTGEVYSRLRDVHIDKKRCQATPCKQCVVV